MGKGNRISFLVLLSKINSDIHKIRETAVLNDENADFNISKTNYQLDYTIKYYTGSLLNCTEVLIAN